jgi:hypothetical protein
MLQCLHCQCVATKIVIIYCVRYPEILFFIDFNHNIGVYFYFQPCFIFYFKNNASILSMLRFFLSNASSLLLWSCYILYNSNIPANLCFTLLVLFIIISDLIPISMLFILNRTLIWYYSVIILCITMFIPLVCFLNHGNFTYIKVDLSGSYDLVIDLSFSLPDLI